MYQTNLELMYQHHHQSEGLKFKKGTYQVEFTAFWTIFDNWLGFCQSEV